MARVGGDILMVFDKKKQSNRRGGAVQKVESTGGLSDVSNFKLQAPRGNCCDDNNQEWGTQ